MMPTFFIPWPLLASATPTRWESLGEGLTLMLVGMVVVFVALVSIGVLVAMLNAALPPEPVPDVKPGMSKARGGADGRLLAVIAAAAAVAVGGAVKVRSVEPAADDADG